MLRAIIIAIILLLPACGITQEGNTVRVLIKQGSEKIVQETLSNILWGLCFAMPIGVVEQRFKGELAEAYDKICGKGQRKVMKQ